VLIVIVALAAWADPHALDSDVEVVGACQTCHTELHAGAAEHLVAMPKKAARQAKKAGLELSDGAAVCTTCHLPRFEGSLEKTVEATESYSLRLPVAELCTACH